MYTHKFLICKYGHFVMMVDLDADRQGQLEQIMLKIEPPSIWAQAPTDEAAYTFSHQV